VDNSATFEILAPLLVNSLNADIIAIDFAGHGQSNHRLNGSSYFQLAYAYDIAVALDKLPWTATPIDYKNSKVVLIGHSMGGGLSTVLAGAFPEKVSALVLIDSLGLSARAPLDICKGFRNAVHSQVSFLTTPHTTYSSIDEMVEQRLKTVQTLPGSQSLTRRAAERLVKHASIEVAASGAATLSSSTSSSPLYRFTHDKRVVSPSLMFVDEAQAMTFLSSIQCSTLVVQAENGWPLDDGIRKARVEAFNDKLLSHVLLPGSHHLHLDEHTAGRVGEAVTEFLKKVLSSS
jgi:pimeloyl-ACP methyl ester carboxylesterase